MLRLSQERQQLLERENEALQQRLRNGESSKSSRLSPSRMRQCCDTSSGGSGSTSSGMPYRSGSPNTLARRSRTTQSSKTETVGTSARTKAAARPRSPVVSPKSSSRGLRSNDVAASLGTSIPVFADGGRGCLGRSSAQAQVAASASSSCLTPTVVTAADLAAMEAGQEHSEAVAAAAALEALPMPMDSNQRRHALGVRTVPGTSSTPQSTSRAVKLQRRPGLVPLSGAASSGTLATAASQDTTQRRQQSPASIRVATSRPRSTSPTVAGSSRGSGPNGSPGPASAVLRRTPLHSQQPTQGGLRRTSTDGRRCPPSPTRGSMPRRSLPAQRAPSPGSVPR